ncbi:transmembrane protein 119b [Corythoichthys intestinalis]|uniref:transmembrane protein 119b n=1 Tax=Corythoichthys intestinalis TaxID=161448 RepID=UPI0025A65955|nr:transmembrane protein 119b [Corythoichthys intestinalis]
MNSILTNSAEGSADLEEPDNFTSSVEPPDIQTAPQDFLDNVADFLREHMVLVLLGASVLLILGFTICGAVYLMRRRRLIAYYPSSYPAKMYVDLLDKKGGASGFREIPDRQPSVAATGDLEGEPVDSNRQLQVDIMRVAKSLKTPTKTPEDVPNKDERPASPRAALKKAENETQELRAKSLRPSSLHLHSDSATLQLIAGEKTAF